MREARFGVVEPERQFVELEAAIHRDQLDLKGQSKLRLGVALWHGGLPVDVLPAEGLLDIQLGEDNFAWPPE